MPRHVWIMTIPILLILLTGRASAEFIDEAPYWFWANQWEGELFVDWKLESSKTYVGDGVVQHDYQHRGTIEVNNVVFENRQVKFELVSYSGSGSNATVTSWRKEEADGVKTTGYVSAEMVDTGETTAELDSATEIMMDFEKECFQIDLILPEDVEVPLTRRYHLQGEGHDGERYWQIHEDETYEGRELPHFIGSVKKCFPAPGNGFDDSEDMSNHSGETHVFTYRLTPSYDQAQWLQDYQNILRFQRQRYIEKWNSIIENCGCTGGCVVCRAGNRALDNLEEWINYLADDGVRICRALVEGKAPGLLSRIRKDYSGEIVRHVKASAAFTVNVIHQYLYHFYDSRATGSIDAIYERLPSELKQVYTKQQFRNLNEAF